MSLRVHIILHQQVILVVVDLLGQVEVPALEATLEQQGSVILVC